MYIFNLGKVSWQTSQLLYHALAYSGREALVLLSPSTPYVCLGFHQDAATEVDLEFCRTRGIPVFRREVGGGAVYLDGDQFFFQLILKQDNSLIPARKQAFFEKFLQPVVRTYQRIGIPATYKSVNDVLADGRKISGAGVGEIGKSVVFVGNLILDFDYEMMSKVLKVPDEKFRDKIHKTLRENLTTIRQELGFDKAAAWDEESLNGLLRQEFGKLLGGFSENQVDEQLSCMMNDLSSRMMSSDWLNQKGRKPAGRSVKIQTGVNVVQKTHKAQGGLIRASYELRDNRLFDVSLSGDFFCYPPEAIETIESSLQGAAMDDVKHIIERVYAEKNVETTGIGISDWMAVLGG